MTHSSRPGAYQPTSDQLRLFSEAFGGLPTLLSRAPGRVNLIGEHTDYNGLPVLPMAIQKEIRLLFRPRDDATVRVLSEEDEFEPRAFEVLPEIPTGSQGDWGNYLKAPCQALAARFEGLRGFDGLVSSTLPIASGLSSSSALVIAVGQALLFANHLDLPILGLAEEMARAERYTGTQGGGMDQAISLGAKEGHASRIEFDPLRMVESPVPESWCFIVANTLVRAEKSGAAQRAYNQRRAECEEALTQFVARTEGSGLLPPGPESLTYASLIQRVPVAELTAMAEGSLDDPLRMRFRHVVTEAARVYEAERALRQGNLLAFGILMDASHESLQSDYQVSSPELDRLVSHARAGGAAGARLTGAGFGGCMVALAQADRVEGVMDALREGYFAEQDRPGPLEDVLFVADPSQGAEVRPL